MPIFGYPITEVLVEDGRHVQYFERARFELHRRDDGSVDLVLAPLEAEAVYAVSGGVLIATGSITQGEFVPHRVFNL